MLTKETMLLDQYWDAAGGKEGKQEEEPDKK